MKCVFLDFDGVLNSHKYLYSGALPEDAEFRGNEHLMLDPEAIARLNRIVEATGAKIVISSSWRHGWPLERLREILATRGFVGDVIDTTPDRFGQDFFHRFGEQPARVRGDEIAAWLSEQSEVESFVVLDDDADDSAIMQTKLVHTSFQTGLLDHHVAEAIRMLGGMIP